jgi:HK97 gp10 family phage protein
MTYSLKTKAMKLEGVPELVNTIRQISATLSGTGSSEFNSQLQAALMKPASTIRDEARDLVPVVTGTLRAAIFAAPLDAKRSGLPGAMVAVKGVYYAPFVEYGTSKMSAHPYFRPAINATRPLAANMMAGDLRDLINQVAAANAVHQSMGTA